MKGLLIVIVFCLVCVVWPSYSHAHRMLVDCLMEDDTVFVDVFFPDGKPAKNVEVEVHTADGTVYSSGETDEEGRFSFDPGDATYFKVVAIGSMGHRVEQEVSLRKPAVGAEEAKSTGGHVSRRQPIPFREILAGFGYIFGVAGILMYLKARSDLRKANVSPGDG